MNIYQTEEFFKKMYPEKKISLDFDEKCHRTNEIILTDGIPNVLHHIEFDKVKVVIEGMDPIYVSIMPHRLNVSWSDMKNLINSKSDVFLHEMDLDGLCELEKNNQNELFEEKIKYLSDLTGLAVEKIKEKKEKYQKEKDAKK